MLHSLDPLCGCTRMRSNYECIVTRMRMYAQRVGMHQSCMHDECSRMRHTANQARCMHSECTNVKNSHQFRAEITPHPPSISSRREAAMRENGTSENSDLFTSPIRQLIASEVLTMVLTARERAGSAAFKAISPMKPDLRNRGPTAFVQAKISRPPDTPPPSLATAGTCHTARGHGSRALHSNISRTWRRTAPFARAAPLFLPACAPQGAAHTSHDVPPLSPSLLSISKPEISQWSYHRLQHM